MTFKVGDLVRHSTTQHEVFRLVPHPDNTEYRSKGYSLHTGTWDYAHTLTKTSRLEITLLLPLTTIPD